MRPRPIGLALLVVAALGIRLGGADDRPAEEAARASKMAAEELKRWSIRAGADPGRIAAPRPDPVLRYSNPGVGRVYGEVFLFLADGRPEAVMAIYKWFSPWTGFEAEMHSLSASALTAGRDGRVVWEPDRPAIERQDVPGAPTPAASAVERLGQMRSIAAGFGGRLLDARVETAGQDQSLRLLPRPLYRYEPRDSAPRDGALFAFVLGTDPEFFLLLEAGDTPRGPRWQYGLARMNRDPLLVTYQGKEVWKVGKVEPRGALHAPYFSMELPRAPPEP
jgi:hypothetical protein